MITRRKRRQFKSELFSFNPLLCPIEARIWTSFLMVSFSRLLEQMEKLEIQKTDKHENKVTDLINGTHTYFQKRILVRL